MDKGKNSGRGSKDEEKKGEKKKICQPTKSFGKDSEVSKSTKVAAQRGKEPVKQPTTSACLPASEKMKPAERPCSSDGSKALQQKREKQKAVEDSVTDAIDKMSELMIAKKYLEASKIGRGKLRDLEMSKDKVLQVRFCCLLAMASAKSFEYEKAVEFYKKAVDTEGVRENVNCILIYEKYIEALEAAGKTKELIKRIVEYIAALRKFEQLDPARNAFLIKKIEDSKESLISILRASTINGDTFNHRLTEKQTALELLQIFMLFKADPISRGLKKILLGAYRFGEDMQEDASYFDEPTKNLMNEMLNKLAVALSYGEDVEKKMEILYQFCNDTLRKEDASGFEKLFAYIIRATLYLGTCNASKVYENLEEASELLKTFNSIPGMYKVESTIKMRRVIASLFEGQSPKTLYDLRQFVTNTMLKNCRQGKASKDKAVVEVLELQVLFLYAAQHLGMSLNKCEYAYSDGGVDFLKDPFCRLFISGLNGKILATGQDINMIAFEAIKAITNVKRYNTLQELYWLILSVCALRDSNRQMLVIQAIEKMREKYGILGAVTACEAMQIAKEYFGNQEALIAKSGTESLKALLEEELRKLQEEINNYKTARPIEEKRSVAMLNLCIRDSMKRGSTSAAITMIERAVDEIQNYSPVSVQFCIAETINLWLTGLRKLNEQI